MRCVTQYVSSRTKDVTSVLMQNRVIMQTFSTPQEMSLEPLTHTYYTYPFAIKYIGKKVIYARSILRYSVKLLLQLIIICPALLIWVITVGELTAYNLNRYI